MSIFRHWTYMIRRHLRGLRRAPFYIAFSLLQPAVWLLLFSQLMRKVVQLPQFGSASYIDFVVPGIVMMTACFSGGWNGLSMIMDLERGVMDRFLVSPVNRSALIAGPIIALSAVTVIQSSILIFLGLLMGARYSHALVGLITMLVGAILLASPFAALSNAVGLVLRKREAIIGAYNFFLLPLTFTSSVFMARQLMPEWMQTIARYNPINWAVAAAREALKSSPDWNFILFRFGLLIVLAVLTSWLATSTFHTYQRSA